MEEKLEQPELANKIFLNYARKIEKVEGLKIRRIVPNPQDEIENKALTHMYNGLFKRMTKITKNYVTTTDMIEKLEILSLRYDKMLSFAEESMKDDYGKVYSHFNRHLDDGKFQSFVFRFQCCLVQRASCSFPVVKTRQQPTRPMCTYG